MCNICKRKGLAAEVDSAEMTTPRKYQSGELWKRLRSRSGCVSEEGLRVKRRRLLKENDTDAVARASSKKAGVVVRAAISDSDSDWM